MYAIGKFLIDAIVVMFFVGIAGSVVVIIISFIEDFRELFGSDDGPAQHEDATPTANLKPAAYSYSSKKESLRQL